MKDKTWQNKTLQQLKDLLQSFSAVQAVFVIGSLANDAVQPDFWSDIDLMIVISDDAINQFYPGTEWLKPIHSVFATSQTAVPPRYTLRVCFKDMHRVDFIFLLSSALDDPACRELHRFQSDDHVLFSRSPGIERVLSEESPVEPTKHDPEAQFLEMTNDFWFKGTLAVYKVARNDLLIALHLTLDLARDCLVLRMMLRDRAEGTNHHRIGGVGNELVAQMNAWQFDYSKGGILVMIEFYSKIYDRLAKEWMPEYEAKSDPLLDWIQQAQAEVTHMDTEFRR